MTEDHSMMSNQDRLVYMANQIARNFMTMGEEKAAQAVADHIAKFWEPRMRAQIFALHEKGAETFAPVAGRAITLLHAVDSPPPQIQANASSYAIKSRQQ